MPNPSQEAAAKDLLRFIGDALLAGADVNDALFHKAVAAELATALTEARSAALKEAAVLLRQQQHRLETWADEHRYSRGVNAVAMYEEANRVGFLAAEIDRMAWGAEDTSTGVSATPEGKSDGH